MLNPSPTTWSRIRECLASEYTRLHTGGAWLRPLSVLISSHWAAIGVCRKSARSAGRRLPAKRLVWLRKISSVSEICGECLKIDALTKRTPLARIAELMAHGFERRDAFRRRLHWVANGLDSQKCESHNLYYGTLKSISFLGRAVALGFFTLPAASRHRPVRHPPAVRCEVFRSQPQRPDWSEWRVSGANGE